MPKRKSRVKLQERPRNLLTLVAIAQKGGAHGKSEKAERRAEHQLTRMDAREAFASRGDDLRSGIQAQIHRLFAYGRQLALL